MVKIGTKLPNLCLNRIRPLARVRSTSPTNSADFADQEKKDSNFAAGDSGGDCDKPAAVSGRKIMIVVESSVVAKNAVQWALSHAVQNQDLLILLYVAKPSKQGDRSVKNDVIGPRIPEFLTSMKSMCQVKRPEVCVEVEVVEGKEKGPAIVEAAKRQEAALLVVGQKKRSVTWRLMLTWAGSRVAAAGGGVAEYCVQNATCMAIAVRRKSKKVGGYLITTKRQKDFWLLA
ncbi:hypothetical protein C2S52_022404 [Perilla frutescens var. hirtella]|uniref:UspA domain-containing protein n=1 Tax=Perilla frutescens var. hirtella TaxID=608512 RepID=A0AAD4IX12_PERFH|nr:hypothetical protein C2S52_022404 [Perilla frutescens var. hirtella]KAH6807231.1 hypothetical protein C2S51_028339 [Perilla frutescens var. frutescens]KAH6823123.1 hypothetical protein C2S53_011296 [Perilla frutescens var. hirtella]